MLTLSYTLRIERQRHVHKKLACETVSKPELIDDSCTAEITAC